MVEEINNNTPDAFKASNDQVYSGKFKPHLQKKAGFKGFKDWLGTDNYKKFKNNLLNSINTQISKDRARQKKVAKRLRLAEEGKDYYNV